MIHSPVPTSKEKEALECAKQVSEFMQNGGEVQVLEPVDKRDFKKIKVGFTETRFT